MPIFLLGAILAAIGSAAAVAALYFALLHWNELVSWFRKPEVREAQKAPNTIAFTIKQAKENGDVRVVQGIFDEQSEEVVGEARDITAEQVDEQVARMHEGKTLVIYK